jgi:DNA primase
MFNIITWPREGAEGYHRPLPEKIRAYLKGRGIPATLIEEKALGWDGERIVIPIFGRQRGEVLGFRYAKSPEDRSDSPKMLSERGAKAELYGWETLARKNLRRVVICEGEFDRLVLEASGIEAVTSTGGPEVFLPDWVPYFAHLKHVYLCFDRDATGDAGAAKVKALLPFAHIVKLPAEVGEGGDVTDYFVGLGRTRVDFEVLLASAAASDEDERDAEPPVQVRETRPSGRGLRHRAAQVRKSVRLHEIVNEYATLWADGGRLIAHCPFHDDRSQSFTVYPKSDTYYCSGCEASGDVLGFLINKESITIERALHTLECFAVTHELFGTAY